LGEQKNQEERFERQCLEQSMPRSRRILLSKVTVVNSDIGIHPARAWGLIPVSIANYAIGLTFTASASLIAIAQFGSRGSGPKDTAKLAQTLDHLTDKNQQLQKENQELVGEVAAVRNKLAGPSEARTKVKAGKTIANISAWFLSCVRRT
jgi:hypothetical protein